MCYNVVIFYFEENLSPSCRIVISFKGYYSPGEFCYKLQPSFLLEEIPPLHHTRLTNHLILKKKLYDITHPLKKQFVPFNVLPNLSHLEVKQKKT